MSKAEREGLTLKAFIERLPPVPFVRPAIRTFVAYLATGDRNIFRRQLRAVFDSSVAFHIRRLIAESLAEQVPHDEDWPLIRHLHSAHREVFNALYIHASSIQWHHFWLKFLVPAFVHARDANSLTGHVYQIARWKKADTANVLSFWSEVLKFDWVDRNRISQNLGFELRDIDSTPAFSTASLLETLLNMPRQQHDFLGCAIARCVATGGENDGLLWRYIAGDIIDEDVLAFHFDNKLHCTPHEFGNDSFLAQRMQQSVHLLDLAIESIEHWVEVKSLRYGGNVSGHEGFLYETSFNKIHSSLKKLPPRRRPRHLR